jgi:hypothetical protein
MSERKMWLDTDDPEPDGEDRLLDFLAEIRNARARLKDVDWGLERLEMKAEYMLGTVPKHTSEEIEIEPGPF